MVEIGIRFIASGKQETSFNFMESFILNFQTFNFFPSTNKEIVKYLLQSLKLKKIFKTAERTQMGNFFVKT